MAEKRVTHLERMQACIAGETVDRPPVALWRHFPVDDQTPDGLAAAHLWFQHTFDFDLLKVTPASSYCLKDWGVQDEWHGVSEGTRDYTHSVIRSPEDWGRLPVLDPSKGSLKATLEALRMIVNDLGKETPVIQTIFSPMAQAKNLIGRENLMVDLRRHPDALRAGLKIITESTRRFVEAARQTGIAGIFYAVQHAQYGTMSVEEYNAFGRPYDMQVFESAGDLWLNLLHLHGEDVMFGLFLDYPVAIINWHDQDTPPSLAEGKALFPGVVCGGLQRERTMVLGTPESVTAEAQRAIEATNGRKFLLGTGCVVPITAPYGNLMAARRSVEAVKA